MRQNKNKLSKKDQLPKIYEVASKLLKQQDTSKRELKSAVFKTKFEDQRRLYGLLCKAVQNRERLRVAIAASNLHKENKNFDPYLAIILATELLSNGCPNGGNEAVDIFRKYQHKIKAEANIDFSNHSKVKSTLPCYVKTNIMIKGTDYVHTELQNEGYELKEYKVNTSYDDFLELVKGLTAPNYLIDYHFPEVLVFPPDTLLWSNALFTDHVILIEDKATWISAIVSGVRKRCNVIDACGASGFMAFDIAAKMRDRGKLIVIEKDQKRFLNMRKLLQKRQVTCATTVNMNFLETDPSDYKDIEYIFVDPTCTASGTSKPRKLSDETVEEQKALLTHALSFPGVKEVIYSTSSIFEEENEKVVEDALIKFPTEFELSDLSTQFEGWKSFGLPSYEFGPKCLRVDQDIDSCTGGFIAKFVKMGEDNPGKRKFKDEDNPSIKKIKKKKKKEDEET